MTQDEVIEKVVEVDARSKSNKHRIDKMEERQDDLERLTTAVSVMKVEQDTIKTDVCEIKGDVKALNAVPAKRWEMIVERAITVFVGALIGYLLNGGRIV